MWLHLSMCVCGSVRVRTRTRKKLIISVGAEQDQSFVLDQTPNSNRFKWDGRERHLCDNLMNKAHPHLDAFRKPTQSPDLFISPFQSVHFLSNCPFGDLWVLPACLILMILLSFRANNCLLAEMYMECMSRLGPKVMSGIDPGPAINNNVFMTTNIHIQQHLPDPSCTIHGTYSTSQAS